MKYKNIEIIITRIIFMLHISKSLAAILPQNIGDLT